LAANFRSHAFYKQLGGVPVAQGTQTLAGAVLPRILFGWDDLSKHVRPARRVL